MYTARDTGGSGDTGSIPGTAVKTFRRAYREPAAAAAAAHQIASEAPPIPNSVQNYR